LFSQVTYATIEKTITVRLKNFGGKEKMNEKISIIIPVYNVERYLRKCLNSLVQQTYHNLEIILVDDGSPDSSGQICDWYAKKDSRIHVIHKKNEGVARARNDGIEYASGDYISFVDSDDWMAANAYETLYKGLKRYCADCAVGGCVKVIDKGGALQPKKRKHTKIRCQSSAEAMRHVLLEGSAIWNRLFKRELFEKIRFPLDRVNDDEVVALHVYAECKKIVFLDKDTYFYRIRQDSITTSAFSLRNIDYYYNSIDNLEFIKNKMPRLVDCAEYKYIKTMLYSYVNLKRIKKNPKADKIRQQLYRDIKSSRMAACRNSYVTLPMKALMFLCAL